MANTAFEQVWIIRQLLWLLWDLLFFLKIFSRKVVLERETEISQQVVGYISSVMNTQFVKNNQP
ncbi:hypothetical protein RGQ29_009114 [Quercus rubra]|uniref:Uncharacterized protein n=1 Tax=Quercus rubra TaxID=3512 RepID=A0AAN7E222_QUERU|nr:hypothetical protein RGQ29_009114 [Quercus rubra]